MTYDVLLLKKLKLEKWISDELSSHWKQISECSEEPIQASCYSILQLPISNSSRKKEYINTSPAEERVGLTKSLAELEELKPDSKDVTYKSNIDRYTMRPKKLEMWSLSDYVAKIDIVYPKKKDKSHKEWNDDIYDINELEDQDESVSYWMKETSHFA